MIVVAFEEISCVSVNTVAHQHLLTCQVSILYVKLSPLSAPEKAPDLLKKDTQFVWMRKAY
jgi:hypothetical protein